ncbi:MAG: hypothetical protein ACJAUM_001142 [Pseudomonadales bacterium]|jgi:hypothetical protein
MKKEKVMPSNYSVNVLDKNNKPISNVVVEFYLLEPAARDNDKLAIMDQIEEQFAPHLLIYSFTHLLKLNHSSKACMKESRQHLLNLIAQASLT